MADDLVDESNGQDIFFTLPLELRQKIYKLAYGKERVVKVKSRADWQFEEDRKRKHEREDFVVC